MSSTFLKHLQLLRDPQLTQSLQNLQCGIEKEGLRVTPTGRIAHTPHPIGLGSALTHASITTDYSEALQEFITPVMTQPEDAIQHLQDLHSFNALTLDQQQEQLWPSSMPGFIAGEDDIPIAYYGTSNTGQLKRTYRVGLAWRYGKTMQTIAGIHYNFSPQEHFWNAYQQVLQDNSPINDFRSQHYFGLLRNFKRHAWLLVYLFGASPILDPSFVKGAKVSDMTKSDQGDFYGPFATSLRMSDLGYSNSAQSGLNIPTENVTCYSEFLIQAVSTVVPEYEKIGVKVDGEYRQLNANRLQIENEYYSDIRPKRVVLAGQKPVYALMEKGVQYVEARNIDLNPFLPVGIDDEQAHFINLFLLWCLFRDSPSICTSEYQLNADNINRVVKTGRQPGLTLQHTNGTIDMAYWAHKVFEEMHMLIEYMPNPEASQKALSAMTIRINDSTQTPSAQVLTTMQEQNLSHHEFSLMMAEKHHQHHLQHPLDFNKSAELQRQSLASISKQQQLEMQQKKPFDDYLADYLAQ